MAKTHVKQGDEVVVLTGKKRVSGKILELRPSKNRAVVEGLMMIKRHLKKSEENPEGQIPNEKVRFTFQI